MENTYICKNCGKEINMNNKVLHDSTCFMYPTFDTEKKEKKEKKENNIDKLSLNIKQNDLDLDNNSHKETKDNLINQTPTKTKQQTTKKERCPYCNFDFELENEDDMVFFEKHILFDVNSR